VGCQDGVDRQLLRRRHRTKRQQSHCEKRTKDCALHKTPTFPSVHLESSPRAPRREAQFLPEYNAAIRVESTLLAGVPED
jgi:hypothetical protein